MWVLGQERPMKISANYVAVEDAFTGVLSIVAVTIQNFAEGHIVADVSPSTVIFKSDDFIGKRLRQRIISKDNVGDQPGRALFCIEIDQ